MKHKQLKPVPEHSNRVNVLSYIPPLQVKHSPDVLRVFVTLGSVFTGAALCELLPDVGA